MKRMFWMVSLVAVLAAPVLAEDMNPPEWWGEPGTTWQGWEFNTPEPNPMPDWGNNPLGMSPANVSPIGPWMPQKDRQVGVWPLSGIIDVPINNYPEPNPEKWIWLQLTWQPQQGGTQPSPMVEEVQWGNAGITTLIESEQLRNNPLWWHSTYQIVLPFNPPHEVVRISGDINVSELVIDTRCVPEPGTLVLLATGLLGLLCYAWRRRSKA